MSQALIPSLQRKENFILRKHRELTIPGRILVKTGQIVKSSDTVAEAEFPGDMIILRISEQLGIDGKEVMQSLKVKEGDSVQAGELLCTHSGLFGLFKSSFIAPLAGRIEFISEKTGHLGLRLPSHKVELNAYISGRVIEVAESKSATIETHCTFVQGIFGVGGERQGKLKAINIAPDQRLEARHIPQEIKGCILYGGSNPQTEALNLASSRGAVGLITASIDDKALKNYLGYDLGIALTGNENVSMTLIITEGFGKLGFSKAALELLNKHDSQNASINGATQVRAGALRPEIIIPAVDRAEGAVDDKFSNTLEVGSLVRIIREPYFGALAQVKELPIKAEKIETGAYVRVLRAEVEGKVVTVPRANVELQG